MTRFQDKVVVITGGTRGIGGEASRKLGQEGAKLVLTGRTAEDGERVAAEVVDAGGTAVYEQGDVGIEADATGAVERAVSEYDVLINNAAPLDLLALYDKPVADQTAEEFDKILKGTLYGPVYTTRAAIPHMLERGAGSIVNVSSIASTQGLGGIPAYSTAKGGLNSFTRQVARDYGKQGIRSNAVIIGQFPTEGSAAVLSHPEVAEAHAEFLLVPEGRYGTLAEAAEVILWVASDQASYVQSAMITVDAGATATSTIPDISAIFAQSRA